MDDKFDMINVDDLSEVSGGAGSAKKHVQISGCKKSCNVRSTPDTTTKTNILGQAMLGDRYVFLGWSGSWAKIRYGSETGYVHKKFVTIV